MSRILAAHVLPIFESNCDQYQIKLKAINYNTLGKLTDEPLTKNCKSSYNSTSVRRNPLIRIVKKKDCATLKCPTLNHSCSVLYAINVQMQKIKNSLQNKTFSFLKGSLKTHSFINYGPVDKL